MICNKFCDNWLRVFLCNIKICYFYRQCDSLLTQGMCYRENVTISNLMIIGSSVAQIWLFCTMNRSFLDWFFITLYWWVIGIYLDSLRVLSKFYFLNTTCSHVKFSALLLRMKWLSDANIAFWSKYDVMSCQMTTFNVYFRVSYVTTRTHQEIR